MYPLCLGTQLHISVGLLLDLLASSQCALSNKQPDDVTVMLDILLFFSLSTGQIQVPWQVWSFFVLTFNFTSDLAKGTPFQTHGTSWNSKNDHVVVTSSVLYNYLFWLFPIIFIVITTSLSNTVCKCPLLRKPSRMFLLFSQQDSVYSPLRTCTGLW